MVRGLEPAFTPGRPVWPLAGTALAGFEPDDPDLAIPHGALRNGVREAPERYFAANHNDVITHRPVEPLGPKPAKSLERKWKLALLASCVFHVALAFFFIQATDEAVEIEGADFSGIALLGSPEDQVQSGETSDAEEAVDVTMVTMLDAMPVENVDAEPVPAEERADEVETADAVTTEVEALKPVEEPPAEQVVEAPAEPVQPVERAPAVTTEAQVASPAERTETEPAENTPTPAATEIAPEVLATDRIELVDDDNFVQKPAETQAADPVDAAEKVQAQPAETAESAKAGQAEAAKPEPGEVTKAEPVEAAKVETAKVAKAEPTETRPVEPVKDVKPEPEAAKPAKAEEKTAAEKKPRAEKKTAKSKTEDGKKVAEKADAKPKKSGNGGQNQANVRRGQADGQEKGDNKQASRGGSKNGEVGNASASNYPGKVIAKLRRALRSVPKSARQKVRNDAQVAFTVGAGGGVSGIRIARSSGSAAFDQAALAVVRSAAPFPPIPKEAGRSSWQFAVPLGASR